MLQGVTGIQLMALRIQEFIKHLDQEIPFDLAEKWDNVGLLVGNPNQEVTTILLALDPTTGLIAEAVEKNADTVLTHHPAIFKPLATIDTSQPEGRLVAAAISNHVSLIACHTNLDSVINGVSDILARRLGLQDLQPLLPSTTGAEGSGLGRIGRLDAPVCGKEYLERVVEVLDLPALPVAGPIPEQIETVAVCGGSGSEFASVARNLGADIYISAEIKHNIARWAEECGFCVIDGSHFGTEQAAVELLAEKLEQMAEKNGWQLNILQSETEQHPFHYITKSPKHTTVI